MFGQILNQMDGSNNWRKQNKKKKNPKTPDNDDFTEICLTRPVSDAGL